MDEMADAILREESFEPHGQHHKETIFTIGNGYLSTRGVFEEGYPGERYATLIHGLFDDVPTFFTELANAPDWTSIKIILAGERFSLASGEITSYNRQLDLRNGLLVRNLVWRSPSGKLTHLVFERFASLADQHILCLRVSITPLDYAGTIEVRAGLDGSQDTLGYAHWSWIDQSTSRSSAWLHLRTHSSNIELAMAFRLSVINAGEVCHEGWDAENKPTLAASWQASPSTTVTLEKIVAVATSRDTAQPVQDAQARLSAVPDPGWETYWSANQAAWRHEWSLCDVVIEGDPQAQLALRFNIYQLLIAAPRHDERVSIGAKTLSGFGYRGHVFWDTEVFMLPFFTFTRPEIARNLISYRWHTLPGARRKGRLNGYSGAQYAWESAATGDEVTPTWLPDPQDRTRLVRIWTGDIEIHVSASVAYGILQYWKVTGDDTFLCERGAEIVLETARFWASRAEWDSTAGLYEFKNVIGPDEYHDHVDNNAYTNYLARWHLITARQVLEWLEANEPQAAESLTSRLDLTPQELDNWQHVADHIFRSYDRETLLIEQFDGYFQRHEVDLAGLEPRSRSVQSLLGIEGVNQTQVLKQPDVLMLMYLLPGEFDEDTLRANYTYYDSRTDHTFGSSLGPAISSIIACQVGEVEKAYEHFMRSAHADLFDVRGNAGDGIHGASAGGLWQALVFGFAGLKLDGQEWKVSPLFPPHWRRVAFKFFHRGVLQEVDVKRAK